MCRLEDLKEEILHFPGTCAETVELGRSTGAEVLALPTDLGDDDRVRRLIEGVGRRYGRLDILVDSAMGLTQIDGTFWGAARRLGCPERCRSTVRLPAKGRLLESERTGFILKE